MKKIVFGLIYVMLILSLCICALFFSPFMNTYEQLIKFNWEVSYLYKYNKNASYQFKNGVEGKANHYKINFMGKPGFYYDDSGVKISNLGYRIGYAEDCNKNSTGGILGMGCSFLHGDEIDHEDTLLYKISDWLNVPSYNFSTGSYSLSSMILRLNDLEENGTFELLKPNVMLLGIGGWQYTRSINPFIPNGIEGLAVTYPYIKKERGKVKISDSYNIFSIKYAFELSDIYSFYYNDNKNKYFMRCMMETPRFMFSDIVHKFTYGNADYFGKVKNSITPVEVYDFAMQKFIEIAKRERVKLVVIWLPHPTYWEYRTIDADFLKVMQKYKKDVYFCNVNNYFIKYGFPAEDYHRVHPGVKTNDMEARLLYKYFKENKII